MDSAEASFISTNIVLRLKLFMETIREVARRPSALIGGIMLICIIGISICFPLFYDLGPLDMDLLNRFTPPVWQEGGTWSHPLGTDNLGRDILCRLLYGSRTSLMVGFSAVLLAGIAGIILGLLSGYYGGRVDSFIMRIADIFMAYPFMLLTISIIAVLGPSVFNLILVIGLLDWVIYARSM